LARAGVSAREHADGFERSLAHWCASPPVLAHWQRY